MPDFSVENSARSKGYFFIAGVDEAGRGSWAGPVVAGAVILEDDNLIPLCGPNWTIQKSLLLENVKCYLRCCQLAL